MRALFRSTVVSLILLTACGSGSIVIAPPDGPSFNDDAQAAGCTPVRTVEPYPNGLDSQHIGNTDVPVPPPLATYPSNPPASGPHAPRPFPAGVYRAPPDIYSTIHSLEHAAAIIWYAPGAMTDPEQEPALAELQDFFAQPAEQTKVIVAPFNYPDEDAAGQLPAGSRMALVAWHHVQTCERVSLPVAQDFVAHYRYPPAQGEPYLGDAREPNASIG
jgi:hypothetical protein